MIQPQVLLRLPCYDFTPITSFTFGGVLLAVRLPTSGPPDSITSENQTRYITVTADTLDGYNTTVQSRVLQKTLDAFALTDEMPEGCSFSLGGESSTVNLMVDEMVQWMALALPFVYLVMVAQFQSLLSPFIVLFTVPLAFTGGLLGMLVTGQQLTKIGRAHV